MYVREIVTNLGKKYTFISNNVIIILKIPFEKPFSAHYNIIFIIFFHYKNIYNLYMAIQW